eukprot:g31399.t1
MAAWADLRSMRSLQSQSRSQQRILKSQASLQKRVAGSNRVSHAVSGERPQLPENEVDVLSRLTQEEKRSSTRARASAALLHWQELLGLLKSPPRLDEGDYQARLNLLSMDREALRSCGPCHPQWVQVHIYNLSESPGENGRRTCGAERGVPRGRRTFVGANQALTFSDGPAIGGAFHVGVEVYGAEWSYGVYGVACDPPRSETAHVYECSVYVGATVKSQEQVAELLFQLCQEWRGPNYDVLSHNCCSFGRRLVEDLGVGPMPLWIDRLARSLHGAREAGREALQATNQAAQVAGQALVVYGTHAGRAEEKIEMVGLDVPKAVEVARPHVERAVSDAQVFVVQQHQKASQVLHKVVMHDVPIMVETARPYVEQAGEAVQKAVQEDAPKAMAAAQPYVEHAVNTAMHHTSIAMNAAATQLQYAAEAVQEQLQQLPELFYTEGSSSSSDSEDEAPAPEIAAERPPDPLRPLRAATEQVSPSPLGPGASLLEQRDARSAAPQEVPASPRGVLASPRFQPPRSTEDVRLLIPSRLYSTDFSALGQSQVQWPTRPPPSQPVQWPQRQVSSWMPPLPPVMPTGPPFAPHGAPTPTMEGQRAFSARFTLRESHAAPEDHKLPWIWGITLLIPVLVALVNFVMVMADLFLLNWKFRVTQEAISSTSLGESLLVLMGISALFSAVAGGLVIFFAPSCAGSGIPEAKGYLNGRNVPDFLEVRSLLVRMVALVLAVAAGFPVGREGPMLCIGGCLGIGVARVLATPYLKSWVQMATDSSSKQLGYVLRMSFVLGGAAGIATAFRAPVGAILYLFEEATVTAWSIEFTLRAFVCTVLATIASSLLLDITGYDIKRLLIYDGAVPQPRDWQWQDVPFFILLAIIAGMLSAFVTRGGELEGWSPSRSGVLRFLEVVGYGALCAVLFGLMPQVTPCQGFDGELTPQELKRLSLVSYTCKEGYSEVASLLLSGAEGATKDLFSREILQLNASSVGLTLLVYLPLATGVAGLSIPMGAFVPNMLLGALLGRLFGALLDTLQLQEALGLAHPGVYALIGSAAMLGGFTQMFGAQWPAIWWPPGISVARVVSGFINRHAYDEELVIRKGVPYLEGEPPPNVNMEARQICRHRPLPKAALLQPRCSEGAAAKALEVDTTHYPILDAEQRCLGLISRTLLARTAKAMEWARGSKENVQVNMLPLFNIMDSSGWNMLRDGRPVLVISPQGKFEGLITRPLLIEAIRKGSSCDPKVVSDAATPRSAQLSQPRTHNLPNYIIWAVAFITAGIIGVVNFAMVTVDTRLVTWKFDSMQRAIDSHGVFLGAVTLSAICGLYALGAAALVVLVAPICAGSGLPEAKSYLNGNFVPNMFEPRNFLVRVLGVVLSTAAGFPIGREGPMVCIGGCLGIGVMHVLALPFLRRWVEVGSKGHRPALLIEDDRFRHAKRASERRGQGRGIGCVLGGAAGIATAFSAPIGAILYMLEEVSVIAWPMELTFRTFVATTCGALVTRFCLNFSGFEIDRLVIYQREFQGQKDWNWIDLPFFILTATSLGAAATLYTRLLVASFSLRQRWRKETPVFQRPSIRILEAVLVAMVIAVVWCLVPAIFGSQEHQAPPRHLPAERSFHMGEASQDSEHEHEMLYFVKYLCEGSTSFNQAATLLLSGEEGVVKHLYSRSPDAMSIPELLVSLLVYAPFAATMAGLSIPMGAFIPSMVIGAMSGRLVGEVVRFLGLGTAHAGASGGRSVLVDWQRGDAEWIHTDDHCHRRSHG